MIVARLKTYLSVFALLLVLMQVCRLLFLLFNWDSFAEVSLAVFFYGLRFDVSAICYLLIPYLFLFFFPFGNVDFSKILKVVFFLAVTITVVFNSVDFFYFPFFKKRSSADIFDLVFGGGDGLRLLPQYLKDYYHGFLLAIALVWVSMKAYAVVMKKSQSWVRVGFIKRLATLVLVVLLSTIGIRGGLQLKPISNIDAGSHVESPLIPIVLNTPFSIIRTYGRKGMPEYKYFDDPEQYFTIERRFEGSASSDKNVVVLIVESFAKEYIGYLNDYDGYTPFTDSLMGQSYVFTNALANGTRSVDAVPSILSSVPSLMEEAYIFSKYSDNHISSLASVLKPLGYSSAFFHGGANGTMRFNSFCKQAGIDYYYGLDEYPYTEQDFDGNWGIYDEPYLKYAADVLDTLSKPFVGTVFTLSSHHPYALPEHLEGKFPKGELDIHESIAYADYSLRSFFEYAKTKSWYENTIFVLTADHTSLSNKETYKTLVGRYRIPLLVFEPNKSLAVLDSSIVQQIDIAPMVLDLLDVEVKANMFGYSPFDSTRNEMAYQFTNQMFQFQTKEGLFVFDGENWRTKFDSIDVSSYDQSVPFSADSLNKQPRHKTMKAVIQTFGEAMRNNSL